MPYIDLHEKPFDEVTITKLEIFEDYAQAWIPTFVMSGHPVICIFDFFAGTGYDVTGVAGSPIRILEKIKEQVGYIFQKHVEVRLYLNEYEPNKRKQYKFEKLKNACNEYLENHQDVKRAIKHIEFYNEDFETLFFKLIHEIKKYPSLVYLDQNGIKFLASKYVLALEETKQTDFLYFVSSGYFSRFGNREEFKEHFNIDMDVVKQTPYKFIHRIVLEQLKNTLPVKTKVKLYPFSLMKGVNIHGIIFGASHPRAVDKFLGIAWKRNEVNGQANFDIDDDAQAKQLDIFGSRKLTKVEAFQKKLKDKILNGQIKDNFDALQYVYNEGHIPAHATECLKQMKKDGVITYDSTSPLITYQNVYQPPTRRLVYKILKK